MRFVLPLVVASVLGACTSFTSVTAIGPVASTSAPMMPAPTPSEAPPDCLLASRPELPDVADLVHNPERITEYLTSGGEVDRLTDSLAASGLIPADPAAWPAAVRDLDGDGRPDVVLSVLDLTDNPAPRPGGSLFIWLCREGRYELAFQSPLETDHSAPLVLAAAELTGDSAYELVFARPACGAHTCFFGVGVLQWDGQAFVDRWRGTSEDLPTPTVIVTLADADRPAAITITSGGVQSVGAGPPRAITRRWIWSQVGGGAFTPDTESLSEPVYRIHRVHDADREFREGHYAQAETFYYEALTGPALLDWGEPASRASLEAYVRYRLVLTGLAKGERERARTGLDALVEVAEDVPAAEPYAEMAQMLMAAYEESLDLGAACREVRAFAEAHTTAVLDPLYYGYDNPTYTAEDLCSVGLAT